jgi:quinol monooxygenase YgiN
MELMKQQMKNNLGDKGCLMSSAFRSKTDPNELYVLLGWENPEAIEKHLKSAHDNKFREDLDPLLACPPDFYDWEKIS